MNARTLDSWLLVNYAGYPYTPSCLLPDNGLANLAGVLVRDGRRVKILGRGEIGHSLVVKAHRFSASARRAIEEVGGTAVQLEA